MGAVLLALALGVGAGLAGVLAHFPVVVLAALLAVAGALHITLLRDLEGSREVLLAVAVGDRAYAFDGEPPSAAADVYSFGALAWFCLLGTPPPVAALRPHLVDVLPDAAIIDMTTQQAL